MKVLKDRILPLFQLIKYFPSTKDSYCQTVPVSSGKTQCSSRLCRIRQTLPSPSANVCVSSVETLQITSFSSKISHNVCHHLAWWNNPHIYSHGVPIRISSHSHQLFTDVSVSGWEAHLEPEGILFHEVWTQDQYPPHISLLEMMAVSLGLKQSLLHI